MDKLITHCVFYMRPDTGLQTVSRPSGDWAQLWIVTREQAVRIISWASQSVKYMDDCPDSRNTRSSWVTVQNSNSSSTVMGDRWTYLWRALGSNAPPCGCKQRGIWEHTIHRISFKVRFPAYGASNKLKNRKKTQFVFTPTSRSAQVSCRQFIAWSKHYIYPKVVIRAQMLNNTIVSIKQAATWSWKEKKHPIIPEMVPHDFIFLTSGLPTTRQLEELKQISCERHSCNWFGVIFFWFSSQT